MTTKMQMVKENITEAMNKADAINATSVVIVLIHEDAGYTHTDLISIGSDLDRALAASAILSALEIAPLPVKMASSILEEYLNAVEELESQPEAKINN